MKSNSNQPVNEWNTYEESHLARWREVVIPPIREVGRNYHASLRPLLPAKRIWNSSEDKSNP